MLLPYIKPVFKKITRGLELPASFYLLTKFHCVIAFTSWDIGQYVVRCAIWYQMLQNGILTVGQNAVLTSWNALEQLNQKSVSLNPFVWHSNSYLMFNHLYGICMALEWHTNGISKKNLNCSIATKTATLIFQYQKLMMKLKLEEEYSHSVCNIFELDSFYFVFCYFY